MKKIKLAVGILALSISASASAMPDAVPARWYDNMWSRLSKMAENPGFCKVFSYVQVCQ
jgi:hypothetical protein